jgi:general secretion pathway protein M
MTKWNALSSREKGLVIFTSSFVLFACLYWGAWQPWSRYSQQVTQQMKNEKSLFEWVSATANNIVALRASPNAGGQSQTASQGLNQIISKTANQFNVDLIRMQPRTADQLQVWIKPMPFNGLLAWLGQLENRHGIQVDLLDLASEKTQGVVLVNRLHFVRRSS